MPPSLATRGKSGTGAVFHGYRKSLPSPVFRNAAREQRYHWIADTFDLIPFDAGAARIYGALCANVRSLGRDPKPRRFDMLIAAVAVALGIPLITRNENDFRGIHSALSIIAV